MNKTELTEADFLQLDTLPVTNTQLFPCKVINITMKTWKTENKHYLYDSNIELELDKISTHSPKLLALCLNLKPIFN